MDDATRTFSRIRPRLLEIDYRMLAAAAEAKVVVQGAYSRWREVTPATPDEIEACLATIITRWSLDRHREPNREGRTFGQSRWLEPLAMRR